MLLVSESIFESSAPNSSFTPSRYSVYSKGGLPKFFFSVKEKSGFWGGFLFLSIKRQGFDLILMGGKWLYVDLMWENPSTKSRISWVSEYGRILKERLFLPSTIRCVKVFSSGPPGLRYSVLSYLKIRSLFPQKKNIWDNLFFYTSSCHSAHQNARRQFGQLTYRCAQ